MTEQEIHTAFLAEQESLEAFGNRVQESYKEFNDFLFFLFNDKQITLEFHNSINNPY